MTFKEFYVEWQKRDYILTQDPKGEFTVNPAEKSGWFNWSRSKSPSWRIQVVNGQLKLPRSLESQREAITTAYFKKQLPASSWGFPEEPEQHREYPSDVIDPEVFTKGEKPQQVKQPKQAPFQMPAETPSFYRPPKESMSKILAQLRNQG